MKPASEDSVAGYRNLCLASLSFASGCTDVLTFLKLGNVFTSAMTGNTALLAIEIGRGNLVAASHALTALLAFAIGVALATKVNAAWPVEEYALQDFSRLLRLECVFLTGCAALWTASSEPVQGCALYVIILLSALSMGVQAVAAGILASGINTVVFTSALVRIVMFATAALNHPKDRFPSLQAIRGHVRTFASYSGGALLAATLVRNLPDALIWVPGAAVLFALGVCERAGRRERRKG